MSQLDLDSVAFSRLQLTAMKNDIKVTKKSTAKSLIAALKKKVLK